MAVGHYQQMPLSDFEVKDLGHGSPLTRKLKLSDWY